MKTVASVLTVKLTVSKFSEYLNINGQVAICDGTKCGKGKRVGKGWLCHHNNLRTKFFQLVKDEWDFKKNSLGPENYLPRSGEKAWWHCKNDPCGCHSWQADIRDRTKKRPSTCPFCTKNKPCFHNNFKVNFPKPADDWDYERNPGHPEDYTSRSNEEVWWHCKNDPCGCHRWKSRIYDRTRPEFPGLCPFCTKSRPCPHNNLAIKFPNLAEEWDYKNNEKTPEECSPHGRGMFWWICKTGHHWKTSLSHRSSHGRGCPFCFGLRSQFGYSKIAMEWLQSIEREEKIQLQYFNPDTSTKEYIVPDVGRVDGYCKETNTVYEFHGDSSGPIEDWWHGNPDMFDPDDINPFNDRTFKQLYELTMDRDNRIRERGYKLVVMWESDYVQ